MVPSKPVILSRKNAEKNLFILLIICRIWKTHSLSLVTLQNY
jgi:hypothetical protein